MNRLTLVIITGIIMWATSAFAGTTASWGAQIFNGVGTFDGTPLPNGSNDLILMGGFDISNAQITANGGNEPFLMSHFTTFGTAHIGDGLPNGSGSDSDGYWTAVTNNSARALSLQGKEIFYWVFDSSNPSTADQYGIFTSITDPDWTFPNDAMSPQANITDLSDVPHDMSGILFGSYGTGVSRDGKSPLYNLGVATPVPEPHPVTWIAGTVIAFLLIPTLSRRFNKQIPSEG